MVGEKEGEVWVRWRCTFTPLRWGYMYHQIEEGFRPYRIRPVIVSDEDSGHNLFLVINTTETCRHYRLNIDIHFHVWYFIVWNNIGAPVLWRSSVYVRNVKVFSLRHQPVSCVWLKNLMCPTCYTSSSCQDKERLNESYLSLMNLVFFRRLWSPKGNTVLT